MFDPCRRYRRELCLLASGALSEMEKTEMEEHLAACADCRRYYDELKVVTAPLKSWEDNFNHLRSSQTARRQWARAIQAANESAPARRLTPASAIRDWWRDVIWSSRRIWAGLAAVWMVILAANISLHEHSPAIIKSGPASEMIMTFKDRQKILAELLPDHTVLADKERQKIFLPKPRTECTEVWTV